VNDYILLVPTNARIILMNTGGARKTGPPSRRPTWA